VPGHRRRGVRDGVARVAIAETPSVVALPNHQASQPGHRIRWRFLGRQSFAAELLASTAAGTELEFSVQGRSPGGRLPLDGQLAASSVVLAPRPFACLGVRYSRSPSSARLQRRYCPWLETVIFRRDVFLFLPWRLICGPARGSLVSVGSTETSVSAKETLNPFIDKEFFHAPAGRDPRV